ncbi:ubiquitin carboxyl-terminal hydrolase 37-like [Hemibagrus wyckioides]|uniref:ubiquitin carboxyl-terminal hydrolase 37-like n=2 Tax=Hemibagrus wyckioides TaxID=337641 RepID=UPI00266D7D57|nr:ubiquitin carboxyl-terminal hydrolase 37-like [Hemibagrus wyckioides]
MMGLFINTISSTTATQTSQTSEKSTKKKQGGARKISRWCFWKKSKTSASVPVKTSESTISSATATETSKSSEESTKKKKQGGARKISRWRFWRKKSNVQPAAFTESSSESSEETPQMVLLKLLAGSTPGNTPKATEVKEPCIPKDLKRSFQTSLKSTVMEDRQEVMLHDHERKEERIMQYYWEDKLERLLQELNQLASDNQQKKSVTDLHAFSSKKMMPEGKTPSSDGQSQCPASSDSQSWTSDSFDENSMALSYIPENEELLGGLPNFGNNCYINASLQCLFTAEAFCEQLCNLLDNSNQNIEDTFIRCFAELSRIRKGSEPRYDTESILEALIESAAEINPEFTIDNQNDAHEFLCHCLTQMEEAGRWQGWQEDVHPRCPIKNNFMFQMRNIITCSSCGSQQKNKVDVFNHISLPLVYNSVDQCLYDAVNKASEIESKCTMCGGEYASSRWTFHTLPRFLVMQLNRFTLTKNYRVVKLNTPMDIQPELQIGACPPQSHTPGTGWINLHVSADQCPEPCWILSSIRPLSE